MPQQIPPQEIFAQANSNGSRLSLNVPSDLVVRPVFRIVDDAGEIVRKRSRGQGRSHAVDENAAVDVSLCGSGC
jgi:hypothetical protein